MRTLINIAALAFAFIGVIMLVDFWIGFFDPEDTTILDTLWALTNYMVLFGLAWVVYWVGIFLRHLYLRWR